MTQELYAELWVPRPVAEVFAFFSDERNLERLTPPWLQFRVLGKDTPTMGTGTHIDYQLRVHRIPLRWRSRIEDWVENERFVDTQVRGPYAYWHHTHRFEARKEGGRDGTQMTDHVRYRVPGGGVGQLLLGRWIRKDVETIFRYRTDTVRQLFGS